MDHRHVFTTDELKRYFDRIALPERKRVYNVSDLSDEDKLSFLNLLQKHQLVKVPWENLIQHYSWHRTVTTQPKLLFRKIVDNPGRGGYCMEVNYFFHLILVNLGFHAYMVGSRIYRPPLKMYTGWTHVVNIVGIGGHRYLLDGGLGPNGPHRPFLIQDGIIAPQNPPAQMQLTHETLPQHVDKTQKVWIFSFRFDETKEWEPAYSFVDVEFLPADIVSMNFSPWKNHQSFFTHKVVCVRFATEKEKCASDPPGSPDEDALEGEIDSTMTLNHDVFKWRRNGKKVAEINFETDEERVKVLKDYFGIEFSDEDRESILGTGSQIGSKRAI